MQKKKAAQGKKNKSKGNSEERRIINKLKKEFGYTNNELASSRLMSRQLDNEQVDIWASPEINWPYSIQVKCETKNKESKQKTIKIESILSMKQDFPVLVTSIWVKVNVNSKHLEDLVTMKLSDALKLMKNGL